MSSQGIRSRGYTLMEIMVASAVLSLLMVMIFRLYSYGNSVFNYNYWHQSRQRDIELFYEFLRNEIDSASNRNQGVYNTVGGYTVKSLTTTIRPLHYNASGGGYLMANAASETPLLEFEMNEADTSGLYSSMSDESWSVGKSIAVQYSFQRGQIFRTKTITHPSPNVILDNRKLVLEDVERIKVYQDLDPGLDGNVLKLGLILKHPMKEKRLSVEASFSIKIPFSPETSSWTWNY